MAWISTAHRAYILSVQSDFRRCREKVTVLVDYGENQARVEIEVKMVVGQAEKMEIYRRELAAVGRSLSSVACFDRGLRWADQG